jgi:hypothetical protein
MDKMRYLELIEPALQIVVKKHEDYGNEVLGLKTYFPFGLTSYAQMLHVKSQRLVSLAKTGQQPNYESLEDTVKDMINYAVFLLDAINKGEV